MLQTVWRESARPSESAAFRIGRFSARLAKAAQWRLLHLVRREKNRTVFQRLASVYRERRRSIADLAGRFTARLTGRMRTAAVALLDFLGPVLLRLLVPASRWASQRRMRRGTIRSLWGVTPILTLPLLARCDRLLGIESRSIVFVTYHVAKGFDINLERYQNFVLTHCPIFYRLFLSLVFAHKMLRYDMFHFFYDRGVLWSDERMGINSTELRSLRESGKTLYTYAYGADVRIQNTTRELGRLNYCMHCPQPLRYCVCDSEVAGRNISAVGRYATAMLAMGDMLAYVPGSRNLHYWPIDTDKIEYVGVKRDHGRSLRVAHAPNHPEFKGTDYLVSAIERLTREGHAIELVRVTGVSNQRVLELFQQADVIADQFICGFHGYTTLEAMAVGKPVLCYLRDDSMMIDPQHCPIIQADPDAVYDALKACLDGSYDLAEIGWSGRSYVEHYYSIPAVAARLGELYLETMDLPEVMRAKLGARVAACRLSVPPLNSGRARLRFNV